MTEINTREQLRSKEKFQTWYAKNRTERNKARRAEYKKNPELREKARVNAAAQRKRIQTDGTREKSVTRFVGGQPVVLYRMSSAAKKIGRSPETIRRWARYNWIPEAKDGGHRVFNDHQIVLIKQLAEAVDLYRYAQDYHEQVGSVAALIHSHWDD